MFFDVSMLRSHIVDMAAAEANDLSQRGGREREQLAVAQVLIRLFAASLQCILTIVCCCSSSNFLGVYHFFAIHVVAQAAVDRARRSLDEEERRWACAEAAFRRMFAFTIVTTNIAVGLPGHRPCATCCRCCVAVCLYSSLILIDY